MKNIAKTIAIIDDDAPISDMLCEILQKEGYSVLTAYSGTEALYLLAQERPDLILLDLMLPGLSGEEVLKQISGIPVIVISAKVDVEDKVNLLMAGAVDYVSKPFSVRELLARIAVHLRIAAVPAEVLSFGDLKLDEKSRQVTAADREAKLTKTEFAILKLLMIQGGQAISKSAILERISMDTPDCTESSLKIHVSNLRKKLREASGRDYIEAVWGIGFKLTK
ncbi:response regulator transcription factor [Anaerovoracaceae bacterium 42-11]